MAEPILVAKKDSEQIYLLPSLANRHGLITGATGTGKTITLQRLAESFSHIGVPVFMADVKGDLNGISQAGSMTPKVQQRLEMLGITDFNFEGCPTTLWDMFGEKGHPLRATISEMGPILLSRILQLNETQTAVMNLAFKVADQNGLLLLDLKDLRALLQFVGENAEQFSLEYGNISKATIGAIQRSLIELETQGAEKFFGEPAVSLQDFMQTIGGKGVINILAADKLINSPKLYSTFLLWLLSELFEMLPEVGDMEKPKMVFFFDEAHLLFNDTPEALLGKIEQVVRLIRSKGVGVYFVTQNPLDIPETILGQLGNRVQHALRAFTPKDQKAVKAAATTFRANPNLDTEAAIIELGVGEALVSFLDEKGTPSMVERGFIIPPHSKIGAVDDAQRQQLIDNSIVAGQYETAVDRESAYEKLKVRADEMTRQAEEAKRAEEEQERLKQEAKQRAEEEKLLAKQQKEQERLEKQQAQEGVGGMMGAFMKSASRAVGSNIGREIVRGVLGGIFGSSRRR